MFPKMSAETKEKMMDALFWSALASLLLWVFAKSVGWINTPVIVEQYPVLIFVFGAGIFYQEFRDFKREMMDFKAEMKEFKLETKDSFRTVNEKIDGHEARVGALELKRV